jgi:hypothetical protein
VFTGAHGNGALAASGNADVTAWPTFTANGAGFRGGAWNTVLAQLRSSDRMRANVVDATRAAGYGFRGVRTVNCTAPSSSIVIGGSDYAHLNSTATRTATGGTDYLWNSDLALSAGQGSSSITLASQAAGISGRLICAAVNSCGAGTESIRTLVFIDTTQFASITGGTISNYTGNGTNGINGVNYRIHTFTSGSSTFAAFPGLRVDYLVVGGGGPASGGIVYTTYAAGGGGGQVLSSTTSLSGSSFSVTVGTGNPEPSNGGSSAFGSITALGGNRGGNGGVNGNGGNSGSGNLGGSYVGGGHGAGGGGGNSAAGSPNSGNSPGAGGLGTASSISGSSVTYGTGGTGGCMGCPNPSNGATNTGNGGGGISGNGGSGVVILRYTRP